MLSIHCVCYIIECAIESFNTNYGTMKNYFELLKAILKYIRVNFTQRSSLPMLDQ